MRFKSRKTGGYQVYAVCGTNTVSFAIDAGTPRKGGADTKGLLGFAVEREDATENERYYMLGFKVFQSVIPQPDETTTVSTYAQPIQSFVWDDFTAKPARSYTYWFHPLKGSPKNLDRNAAPIKIVIETEPLYSENEHDIFFNRGIASSQAYARKFGNKKPSDLQPPSKQKEAWEWLSRSLDDAILGFIAQARKGDTLLGCFYEFSYRPVVDALKAAHDKGVDVQLILDGKKKYDKNGTLQPSFPREDTLKTIKAAKLPQSCIARLREARPSEIEHNKFMVLLKGKKQVPTAVWTGSTNISEGGIFGQTNVGHWLRDPATAVIYQNYWDLLKTDPGGKRGDDAATVRKKNAAYKDAVEALQAVPSDWHKIPAGVTPVFSPRQGLSVLDMYAAALDEAKALSCITLAFGVADVFKSLLQNNTAMDHLTFLLLEKRDKPDPKSKKPFIVINAKNNVYQAWGAYLRDPLYQWTAETNNRALGLNTHVSYIHSKFLLVDPLGGDPLTVTGSANFSAASTQDNDENMLLIRGNKRVADIYFTEFNRLFFHYYFRSVQEATLQRGDRGNDGTLFLDETDSWLAKYKPGSLKRKRVQIVAGMQGAKTI